MKKIFSLFVSLLFVFNVCFCVSSCDKNAEDVSSDEVSNKPANMVFTDEYFKDAVRISMTLCSGDYTGEEMNAVIDALKQVPLEAAAASEFPWSKSISEVSEDPMDVLVGMPFEFRVDYADGSYSRFLFTNHFVYFSDGSTEDNYRVPTGDLCNRIMDALGIEGID